MSTFAPPEVIRAALDSGHPVSALYQVIAAKVKVQQPNVTDPALGQLSLYFMAGMSAAFDLLMAAIDRPEDEAIELVQSIHDNIRDFMKTVEQVKQTSH